MRSILSILLPVALAAACGSTSTNAPVAGGSDATTDSGGRPDASRTHPADARADRGVDAAIDAGSDGGLTCPPFDVVCGSGANAFCAPIQVDPDNCGGCGLECPAGTYCSEASCGATCIGLTSALCSGTCVDTQSDNKNCGVCAHPCPAGQVCSAGACAPTCATSYTPCGEGASSYCAETPIDPENCGACGTVCPIGATCSGGHCRAAVRDAGQPAMDSGDLDAAQADAHHVDAGRDAGSCTGLAEGATCASATACTSASTCKSGVCTASALADGTVCGAAPNSCHEAPTCKSGACSAALPVANGTVCGTAPNACHKAPECETGVCAAAASVANGTTCGTAPNACHDAPSCTNGTCKPAVERADGTNWKAGDANALCCGGSPVDTTTTTNCGVCGWKCGSGQTCAAIEGHYLCTGCTADSECASGCCSEDPAPNHCSPSNCAGACKSPDVCTGGSHCIAGTNVDYCGY